jgi:hypothetical protein
MLHKLHARPHPDKVPCYPLALLRPRQAANSGIKKGPEMPKDETRDKAFGIKSINYGSP